MRDLRAERAQRARQAWRKEDDAHNAALELLRLSRETADEGYVRDAAGFWLNRLAPESQRSSA